MVTVIDYQQLKENRCDRTTSTERQIMNAFQRFWPSNSSKTLQNVRSRVLKGLKRPAFAFFGPFLPKKDRKTPKKALNPCVVRQNVAVIYGAINSYHIYNELFIGCFEVKNRVVTM